jgi:hypothetical protein
MRHLTITLVTIAIAATAMQASVITYGMSKTYGATPQLPAPWMWLTIDDEGSAGSVKMTFAVTNLASSEFISKWLMNLDPAMDPTALVFANPVQSGSFELPSISAGVNAHNGGGTGKYDLLFGFTTSNSQGGAKRFTDDDVLTYSVSGIATLTAGSFDVLASPGGSNGPFESIAHMQGIGGEDSAWIAPEEVPEPLTLSVLAAGGMLLLRRRRTA